MSFRRKLVNLLCSVLFCTGVYAQSNTISIEEFSKRVNASNTSYKEAYKKKDYKQAIIFWNEISDCYAQLSETDKKNNASLPGTLFYGFACLYSLENQKSKAVEHFRKAVEAGFGNRAHAEADTDLDNIRKDKRFIKLLTSIPKKDTYTEILQKAGGYVQADTTGLPRFKYAMEKLGSLKYIREYFKLDSIAGTGNETSKIINLLTWVHDNIRHDGNHNAFCEHDAIDIYNYAKANNKGVNCRMLATVLNEFYLAMGFKSRFMTCLPKTEFNRECHVINCVYSTTLNKWLWMDPTNNAYWKDENGVLLSIEEVRSRVIENKTLILNEDANWNHEEKKTKKNYLDDYMAKNLYWFQCPVISTFNTESAYGNGNNVTYVCLYPIEYEPEETVQGIVIHDPAYFWQIPQTK